MPYALYAGAFVTEDDGSKHGLRYHKGFACFERKPFEEVGAILEAEMERTLPIISGWSREYLINIGERIPLGR